jgi:7-carboxy-7-deazaguanine synthase
VISIDIKCPSSGEIEKNILDNLKLIRDIDQVKFVIKDVVDYDYTRKIVAEFNLEDKTNVIFQPLYDESMDFTQKLTEMILNDGLNVRLGLQLHKIVWGSRRGV